MRPIAILAKWFSTNCHAPEVNQWVFYIMINNILQTSLHIFFFFFWGGVIFSIKNHCANEEDLIFIEFCEVNKSQDQVQNKIS